jgi:hypothetical protein
VDKWGGKQTYTYEVLTAGTITYTLTGGGAGGAGAVAVKDHGYNLFAQGMTRADAGWSASGGSTTLWWTRNNTLVEPAKIAQGGAGVDGPNSPWMNEGSWFDERNDGEWFRNGVDGNPGTQLGTESNPLEMVVQKGDIITIEVGYGGGGSGGAAANDNDKDIASGSPNNTTKKTQGTDPAISAGRGNANATRGGMGAMHGLMPGFSGYSAYLQKGEDSAAALAGNSAAEVGRGGQTKGAGGGKGDEYATGGMYASGGGGGAAGGFTLNSSTAVLTEN